MIPRTKWFGLYPASSSAHKPPSILTTMKNENAQLAVSYHLSFPDQGKKPAPPGSELLNRKIEQILQELTFTLHIGRTQSVFFSPHVFDESDQIEQMAKNVLQAGHVHYVDTEQQLHLTKVVVMGEDQWLRDDSELTWTVHLEKQKDINGLTCSYAGGERKTPGWEEPTPVRAWFTQAYLVPFGPADWHGLPGLILQVEANGIRYTATDVKILSDSSMTIELPKVNGGDLMPYSRFLTEWKQKMPTTPRP